jgi:hypothetical protein
LVQDLPRAYGAPTTVWRRLTRWGEEGVWGIWERIWRTALAARDQHEQLNWSMALLDGSFKRVRLRDGPFAHVGIAGLASGGRADS